MSQPLRPALPKIKPMWCNAGDEQGYHLYFHNITYMGPKFHNFVPESSCWGMAVAEHHLLASELPVHAAKLKAKGWRSWWSPAQPTGRGGTSAGTAVLLKSNVQAERLDFTAMDSAGLPSDFRPFTVVKLKLQGFSMVWASLYLPPGHSFGKEATEALSMLHQLLSLTQWPWVITADWNAEPSELEESGWPQAMGGRVLVPPGAKASCTSGSGRMLDFALASVSFMQVVKQADLCYQVPTKPHVAFVMTLRSDPAATRVKVLVAPRTPHISSMDKDKQIGTDGQPIWRLPDDWEIRRARMSDKQRKKDAQKQLGSSGMGCSWDFATAAAMKLNVRSTRPWPSVSELLLAGQSRWTSQIFASWLTAAEVFHATQAGTGEDDLGQWIGRGRGPRLRWTTLGVACRMGRPCWAEGSNATETWWRTALGGLQLMQKLRQRNHGLRQQKALQRHFQAMGPAPIIGEGVDADPDEAWDQMQLGQQLSQFDLEISQLHLEVLVNEAKKWHLAAERVAMDEVKKAFLEWQKAQMDPKAHAKEAHRYVKASLQPMPSILEFATDRGIDSHPQKLVDQLACEWKCWWASEHGESRAEQTMAVISQLLGQARKEPSLPDIADSDLHEAMYSLSDSTAVGSDAISPCFLKRLPPEALRQLKQQFMNWELHVALPAQLLANVVVLLPKEAGGFRPIGRTPMTLRLLFRCRRPLLRRWQCEARAQWDDAVAGSSSLQAAVLRALGVEAAVLQSRLFLLLLFDISKFFDCVPLPAIVGTARRTGYPLRLLGLALLQCLAARTLKLDKVMSLPVGPTLSILPGHSEATNLARMAIYDMMEQLAWKFPSFPTRSYVDDIASLGVEEREAEQSLALNGAALAQQLVRSLHADGYVVSSKSQLVTNSPTCQKAVVMAAAALGVKVKAVDEAKDLGLDVAWKRRGVTSASKRRAKARKKLARVAKLRHRPLRRRLVQAHYRPQAMYASEVLGLPPTVARRHRAAVAAEFGWRPGCCTYTVLVLAKQDLVADTAWRAVHLWARIWRANPDQRENWAKAWDIAYIKMTNLPATSRWKQAKGPITSLVTFLLDLGWDPACPDRWDAPSGAAMELVDDVFEPSIVRAFVQAECDVTQLIAASKGNLAQGMKGGVHWPIARRTLAKLQRQKQGTMKAGLLRTVMAGGLWPRCRSKEHGYNIDSTDCLLCGEKGADTIYHRCWECEVVVQSDLPAIKKSNHLRGRAKYEAHINPALWLRALPLLSEIRFPAAPLAEGAAWMVEGAGQIPTDARGKEALDGYVVYLDESGGTHSSTPELRRAGWGLAILRLGDPEMKMVRGYIGTVGGAAQTQNAAAIDALTFCHTHFSGTYEVCPDSSFLINGWTDLVKYASTDAAHVFAWRKMQQAQRGHQGRVTLRKVPAHMTWDKAASVGISLIDWAGNYYADRLAAKAAAKVELDKDTVAKFQNDVERLQQIQCRAVAAHSLFLEKAPEKEQGQRAELPSVLGGMLAESGHELWWLNRGRRVCCGLCQQAVPSRSLRTWLRRGPCPGRPQFSFGSTHGLRIGNTIVHNSHHNAFSRGIWVCMVCGAYAGTLEDKLGVKKLGHPCTGGRLPRGRLNLTRFWKGQHPRSGKNLPEEAPEDPIYVGLPVKLIGLRSAAGQALNGRQGRVLEFDPLLGRWKVRLDLAAAQEECEVVLVRSYCLLPGVSTQRVETTGAAAAAAGAFREAEVQKDEQPVAHVVPAARQAQAEPEFDDYIPEGFGSDVDEG